MSVMKGIKVTYKVWYKKIIKFILPSSCLKPLSVKYVNDVYGAISAKMGKIVLFPERKEDNLRHKCI